MTMEMQQQQMRGTETRGERRMNLPVVIVLLLFLCCCTLPLLTQAATPSSRVPTPAVASSRRPVSPPRRPMHTTQQPQQSSSPSPVVSAGKKIKLTPNATPNSAIAQGRKVEQVTTRTPKSIPARTRGSIPAAPSPSTPIPTSSSGKLSKLAAMVAAGMVDESASGVFAPSPDYPLPPPPPVAPLPEIPSSAAATTPSTATQATPAAQSPPSPPISKAPKSVSADKLTKKPRAVIKDGKIKTPLPPPPAAKGTKNPTSTIATTTTGNAAAAAINATAAAQNAAAEMKQREKVMANRQKLKDKSTAALHSRPKQKIEGNETITNAATEASNTTTIASSPLPSSPLPSSSPSSPSPPSHSHLDLSHADGDVDVLRRLSHSHSPPVSAASWLSASWAPIHGAFVFILIFTISCACRIVGLFRTGATQTNNNANNTTSSSSSSSASTDSAFRRGLTAIVDQLSSFNWDKKFGPDSPVSTDRTRELASMPFEDGKSRRRGVKAGQGTKGNATKDDAATGTAAGDIEMQSLTATLSSLHIPKMLYLDQQSSSTASCVLTPERLQQLLPYFPSSSHIQDLALKYKLSVCGASINDLYRRCSKMQDAVTVIQDSKGHVFGCYASSPWKIHDSYYGNSDCFVFTLHPHFQVYPSTSSNFFFQLATKDSIALGGGDHFALWLDEGFRRGQSKECQTFASPSLAAEEEFRCHEMEVWSFVDGHW